MTALSWENWVKRYSDKDYRVIAKSWPGMDISIDELRRDPSPIAMLGVTEIMIITKKSRALDRPQSSLGTPSVV